MDNKIYENIKMVTRYYWRSDKQFELGHLELSKLPVPGSITVYLQGHLIQPESFDACGNPIISEEMTKLFKARQQLASRNDPENNSEDIYARVCYEVQKFTVPKDEFDSVSGIQKSLVSLKDFNEMLNNRQRYLKAFENNVELSEFIIWGKYILTKSGKITEWSGAIKNTATKNSRFLTSVTDTNTFPEVAELSIFKFYLKDNEVLMYGPNFSVPSAGSICPICGREISMYDLRTREFSRINGKICHRKCYYDYEKQLRISNIVELIDEVYDEIPKYRIIDESDWSITLSFETLDGNVEIQDTLGAVAIEWQENFKPFDMAIFEKEEEIKWHNVNGKPTFLGMSIPKNIFTHNIRGILARHSYSKAAKYLMLVKETINETK